MYDTKEVK